MKPSDGHKRAAFVILRNSFQEVDPDGATWVVLSMLLFSFVWNKLANRITPIVFVQSHSEIGVLEDLSGYFISSGIDATSEVDESMKWKIRTQVICWRAHPAAARHLSLCARSRMRFPRVECKSWESNSLRWNYLDKMKLMKRPFMWRRSALHSIVFLTVSFLFPVPPPSVYFVS